MNRKLCKWNPFNWNKSWSDIDCRKKGACFKNNTILTIHGCLSIARDRCLDTTENIHSECLFWIYSILLSIETLCSSRLSMICLIVNRKHCSCIFVATQNVLYVAVVVILACQTKDWLSNGPNRLRYILIIFLSCSFVGILL